jgi:DNA polymerase-3 subunit gamma/tau
MENNFIVSARKYRPATFESVVGQGHITSTLKNAIARGQLAHAYLFCGPEAWAKPPVRASSQRLSTV